MQFSGNMETNFATKAENSRNMLLQIRKENIKRSFCGSELMGHRRQHIGTVNGVAYYDDSKAECVNATWFTFDTIIGPTIWIADGKCNGGSYDDLRDKVNSNVDGIVCIGNDKKMRQLFDGNATIEQATDIAEAVRKAAAMAKEGSLVIFSPSTASFAQNEIGETFKNEVMKMKQWQRF